VKWLLDTNVVSETIRRRPDTAVIRWVSDLAPADAAISVVAMAELAEGIGSTPDPVRLRELTQWLDTTVADWLGRMTLPLTRDILIDWLRLSRQLAASRMAHKAPDLLIAATARVHGLTLVTRNIRDFANTGIIVYDPWNDQTHRMDEP
jgi:predicted nucleic acid-binding protein